MPATFVARCRLVHGPSGIRRSTASGTPAQASAVLGTVRMTGDGLAFGETAPRGVDRLGGAGRMSAYGMSRWHGVSRSATIAALLSAWRIGAGINMLGDHQLNESVRR